MLFNSWEFVLFFPVAVGVYFALPARRRNLWLLACSYFFYMCWRADYVVLLLASTLVDYLVGRRLDATERPSRRKWLLAASLVTNLSLLFSFKYFNLFNDTARALFAAMGWSYGVPALDVLLPVGISFYTFQSLSYTVDVYRGETKAERNFVDFALYVSYWPQLVAGPIERSTRLLGQFKQTHTFSASRAKDGMMLMLWGFFKKMIIADRLAEFVVQVYGQPQQYEGPGLLLAAYAFAFQIYCDFSGYTDIAIGAARIMGVELMTNFRQPYFAQSIPEFWTRWHISLSTWFRDYLYIPLGGSRVSPARRYLNLFIVFVISGLWHGADWTLAVWGAMHGAYMVIGLLTRPWREAAAEKVGLTARPKLLMVLRVLRVLCTFHLHLLSLMVFCSPSLLDAWHVFTHLADGWAGVGTYLTVAGDGEVLIALFGVALLMAVDVLECRKPLVAWLRECPRTVRWAYAIVLGLMVLNLSAVNELPFFYFQF